MRIIFFAILLGCFMAPAAQAQDIAGKISCRAFGIPKPQNPDFKKKLWDGYEISLGPARNSQGGGDECTAAIYNSAGHVVFRTTGYNVVFDENHTGQDFDGDGKPEVVFLTDTGGGNHCCWAYNVISLSPKPHKLFDIDAPGAVRFEKDAQGKVIVWRRLPGPYGFTSMAGMPFAEKAFRVREGKLSDATPEFCARIFSDDDEDHRYWKRVLSPENLKKLQSTGDTSVDNEEIVSALLARALQHVFCRQFDAALDDLNLWPESSRAKMKAAFAESIKPDYPEFAARLASPGGRSTGSAGNARQRINWLKDLRENETFLAAKLTAPERKQISEQVEKSSFDVPDSWDAELLVRQVSLGATDGLVIRGSKLLCGGTGNCQTWVFRRSQGNWLNLFEQEAPVVSGFGFDEEGSGGIKNLLVSANSSAEKEARTLFKFDGKFYRQSECYGVSLRGGREQKVEKVPCK